MYRHRSTSLLSRHTILPVRVVVANFGSDKVGCPEQERHSRIQEEVVCMSCEQVSPNDGMSVKLETLRTDACRQGTGARWWWRIHQGSKEALALSRTNARGRGEASSASGTVRIRHF